MLFLNLAKVWAEAGFEPATHRIDLMRVGTADLREKRQAGLCADHTAACRLGSSVEKVVVGKEGGVAKNFVRELRNK